MFERVVEFIESIAAGGSGKSFERDDKHVAIAVLLYRMVTVDGVVLDVEREKLRDLLQDRFGIHMPELEQLISKAKLEHSDSAGLFPFTSVIMRKCDEAERQDIAKAMYQLALCDKDFHEFEGSLLERACELLEIPSDQVKQ